VAKILVVDDAKFMRVRCRNLLEENGYQVVEAGNGKEAIEQFLQERPDLVMLDITMPVMDGLEALKGIRSHDSEAVVIMCSALAQQSMVLQAVKEGARDFIVKPYDPDKILSTVGKFVS